MTQKTARAIPLDSKDVKGWRVKLPGGLPAATPAVAGGKVFIGGGYGSYDFYAFDAATGEQAWKIRTTDDGPTAAVVVAGRVVFNTESCTVYVVEAETGRVVWEKWLGDPLMAQPAADRERIYMVHPDLQARHWLASFELETGKPVWQAEVGHDVITAPVLHRGKLYASTYDGKVHCFSAADGAPEWSKDFRATSAPWVEGDRILVSSREAGAQVPEESLHAYSSATGDRSRRAAYSRKSADYLSSKRFSSESVRLDQLDASVGFGSAPAAAKMASVEALVGEYRVSGSWRFQGSRPVAKDGRVWSIVGDEIECVDLGSGAKVWGREAGKKRDSIRRLSPAALANNKLFVATADGRISCLAAGDGRELWSHDVGIPMEWSPSVAAGRVYVGTADGHLVCVETGDPADDGWPMWGGGPGHNGDLS